MARGNKCSEGAIVTDKRTILGSGYTTYGQYHGETHDKEAGKQQGKHTTRWFGEDLKKERREITPFNYIFKMIEETTAMEVILLAA